MDAIPRIARAQSMDALSSMSSIGGYKSVLIAANALGRYLPMMTTAAGTIKAGRVLVLGAGWRASRRSRPRIASALR